MTPGSETGKPIFFDFSGHAKFRIAGTDRIRFLNGQITNDLRKVNESSAMEACVLNAKGKMDAHIFVSMSGEFFFADADHALRMALKTRLERYIIADDVQIEDVTDEFSLFHVLSKQTPAPEHGRVISARRFAEPGWDTWFDASRHDAAVRLLSSEFTPYDPDAGEVMRIEQGNPVWGRELTGEIIPIEANLEQRAIDYHKGCYIGQEVISRMKMSGQTNKRLCGLISLENIPLQPGMKLVPPSLAGKEVGWITSATHSEIIGKEIALGYVKRGFNGDGTTLSALTAKDSASETSQPIQVEVVPLPFV